MNDSVTYKKAKKMNAVFLLLFFSSDSTAQNTAEFLDDQQQESSGRARSQEYFDEKMKEFERNKYRF